MKIRLVKGHKYIRNGQIYTSVTTFIGKFFKPFDADGIAKKLSKFPANRLAKKGIRYWKNKWKESRDTGTQVHKEIDDYLKSRKDYVKHPKAQLALDYLEEVYKKDIAVYESETIVYSDIHKLAGTVDCIVRTKNGIEILDWKTNEKISQDSYNKEFGILPATKAVPDANYWHYTIQLNMYAYILSKYYNEKVIGMKLIHLQEDGVTVYDIPVMLDLVGEMLEERK